MNDFKVILVGSSGSGKTTAISTISDIDVVNTDVPNTDLENLKKEMTTVGLDYGEVTLPELKGRKIRLYGTPGQARFSFIWKALIPGSTGVILLADNSSPAPDEEIRTYLTIFKELLIDKQKATLLGIIKTDINQHPDCERYRQILQEFEIDMPVAIVDARDHDSVRAMFVTLSEQLLRNYNENTCTKNTEFYTS